MDKSPATVDSSTIRRNKATFQLCTAGAVAYSLGAWGYDFWILAQSHAVFPWIKLIAGLSISVLLAILCSFLLRKIDRLFTTLLCWFAWGGLVSWLTGLLPFRFQEYLITRFQPILTGEIHYPLENVETRLFLIWMVAFIMIFIIGFLYQNVLESLMANVHLGATVLFVVFWLSLFGGMGLFLDNVNHKSFRQAIEITHTTIQRSKLHPELLDSGKAASREGVSAFRSLKDIVQRPYMLAVKEYDEPMEQFAVLVDFDGFWYTCDVGLNIVYNCK